MRTVSTAFISVRNFLSTLQNENPLSDSSHCSEELSGGISEEKS